MPTLIHIADERNARKIEMNGIKIGKGSQGIFFMPISQDYYASHQWVRELKAQGAKTMVGIYFKMKSDEMVWFGRYNENHQKLSLGRAIKQFMEAEDRLGLEFMVERKIEVREIAKIQTVSQKVGWRHSPGSHTIPLNCGCPLCVSRGSIKARKKIDRYEEQEPILAYPEIIKKLKETYEEEDLEDLFGMIRTKNRRADPNDLRFIIEKGELVDVQYLALSLSSYKHPNAAKMLVELCSHQDADVREFSAQGLLDIDEVDGLKLLHPFQNDAVIREVIDRM